MASSVPAIKANKISSTKAIIPKIIASVLKLFKSVKLIIKLELNKKGSVVSNVIL